MNKKVIYRHTFSWLDHAFRHFKDGLLVDYDNFQLVRSIDEILMYLCLFEHEESIYMYNKEIDRFIETWSPKT